MKKENGSRWAVAVFLVFSAFLLAGGCTPTPTAVPVSPYMRMDPPPDSDKTLPVPAGDNSCWMHAASNLLAGAGYGTGTTVQARADDIFTDMNNQYGTAWGGWMDTALQWWLGSSNNTWTANPYTVVTVLGNKSATPWTNTNGPRDIGNYLRGGDFVGVSITWIGVGGHSITAWGDDILSPNTLTANPAGIRVTNSDTDSGGDVQAYTYDSYTNPNPGGTNAGNGWYFNYGSDHPFIKHIAVLSPTSGAYGTNTVHVLGSYKIQQTSAKSASDLHYKAGTDVDILSYRTWNDWGGTPSITEASPRRQITVDWTFDKSVPTGTWVTISTEFIESSWNAIKYSDVKFTYPDGLEFLFPDLTWSMESPRLDRPEAIPDVTGGFVIGSFDMSNPQDPEAPVVQYRFVHEYLYYQSPEHHFFTLTGSREYQVSNLLFGHSYGYPTEEELWEFKDWMSRDPETYSLADGEIRMEIDWKGLLPYPKGDN